MAILTLTMGEVARRLRMNHQNQLTALKRKAGAGEDFRPKIVGELAQALRCLPDDIRPVEDLTPAPAAATESDVAEGAR